MGIFGDYARKYFECGYNVVPCRDKSPFIQKWQQWCETRIPEQIFERFETVHSDCNIGLCTGPANSIVVVDFDYEGFEDTDYMIELMETVIPPSPVAKRGQKGFSRFYFEDDPRYMRSWQKNRFGCGPRVIDFLATGKQTIIPPSWHNKANKAYEWIGSSLLDVDPKDLPRLPHDFEKRVHVAANTFFTDNNFKVDKTKVGRHDQIYKFAVSIMDNVESRHELIEKMIDYDQKKFATHAKGPYFTDTNYFNSQRKIENIVGSFADRIIKSVKNAKAVRGEDTWDVGQKDEDGFYYKEKKWMPDYRKMAEWSVEHGNMCFSGREDIIYKDNYWQPLDMAEVNSLIEFHNRKHIVPSHVDQFRKLIMARNFFGSKSFKDTTGLINLQNGVLSIRDKVLLPHSREYLFKTKTPIAYNANAQCSKWLEFLNSIFSGDSDLVAAAQKMFGYILMGGRPYLHKTFVLVGDGRNGKSTFLDVLRLVLGEDNCTAVPLKAWSEQFAAVTMIRALANILDEDRTKDKFDAEAFKNITAGGMVRVSYKGKDEFFARIKCRHVIACNKLPNFNDDSFAVEERLYIIPFKNNFVGKVNDLHLLDKLTTELSGILNWAIDGVIIMFNGDRLEQTKASIDAKEEYKRETNPFYDWFQQSISVTQTPRRKWAASELYQRYKFDVELSGYNPVNINDFSKRMKKQLREACSNIGVSFNDKLRIDIGDSFKRVSVNGYDVVDYNGVGAK